MKRSTVALLSLALAAPASAQMVAGTNEKFLDAIRYNERAKVEEMMSSESNALVNTRGATGETPLMIAIGQRSLPMLGYLLFKGAEPNTAFGEGEIPLVAAARKGWSEGVDALIEMGAKVDGRNRHGETALIAAVQARSPRLVRQLLARGANPDISDRLAGFSARDYARRDNRMPELLRLIETAPGKPR